MSSAAVIKISSPDYDTFISCLRDVCKTKGRDIQIIKEKELRSIPSVTGGPPDYSLDEVVKKVSTFTQDNQVLFFAAEASGVDALIKVYSRGAPSKPVLEILTAEETRRRALAAEEREALRLKEASRPKPQVLSTEEKVKALQSICDTIEKGNFGYFDSDRISQIREIFLSERFGLSSWISLLSWRIHGLDEKLFNERFPSETCPIVRWKKFLQELYIEITSQGKAPDVTPFDRLEDPAKKERITTEYRGSGGDSVAGLLFSLIGPPPQKKVTKAGPHYGVTTDQTLACAFVLKPASKEKREVLLRHILEQFKDYKSKTPLSYPLLNILFGVVQEKDFPDTEKDSLLKEHLMRYQGIFSEEIDPKLKKAYWEAIKKGQFGEPTMDFVDAIAGKYRQEATGPDQKERIYKYLKRIAGVKEGWITGHRYSTSSEDPIVNRARVKLEELKI